MSLVRSCPTIFTAPPSRFELQTSLLFAFPVFTPEALHAISRWLSSAVPAFRPVDAQSPSDTTGCGEAHA